MGVQFLESFFLLIGAFIHAGFVLSYFPQRFTSSEMNIEYSLVADLKKVKLSSSGLMTECIF